MTRRRFTFWLGLGLFGLSNKLGIDCLDALAAAAMEGAPNRNLKPPLPEHWTTASDEAWTWFERENYINGQWLLTGTTRPVNRETGELKSECSAYLDDHLLPADMRPKSPQAGDKTPGGINSANKDEIANSTDAGDTNEETTEPHQLPTSTGRARHGRPPSKWLRSLNADELRIWLGTVEIPEAGVSGMTYWEHLTRDHSFDAAKIEGLEIAEQAKLHAAAHFGY
jgi:hypothetical protein